MMALNLLSGLLSTARSPRSYHVLSGCHQFWRSNSNSPSTSEEDLQKNPYYEKYAGKIAALQQTSPEEFESRVVIAREKKKKRSETVIPRHTFEEWDSRQASKQPSPATRHPSSGSPSLKLDDIMKVELIQEKTAEEISELWKNYHATKNGIFAVIPSPAYDRMFSRSQEFPTFLYPLPRNNGYQFVMSQFSGHECYFTPLISFQAYKENAPVCLNVKYYSELQKDKGIVLMHGEYDANALKPEEAHYLANQLQLYYGGEQQRKKFLLWQFNKEPHAFKHQDLVTELESDIAT